MSTIGKAIWVGVRIENGGLGFCLFPEKNEKYLGFCVNLAGKRAEVVWVLKASVTGAADVSRPSELPCLWPLI